MAQFVPVVSSALAAVKYDRETQRLVIQFGDVFYEYDTVSSDVVVDFLFADSIGSAFSTLVKKGGFAFRKITAAQAHA
jgi:hypothetical protein